MIAAQDLLVGARLVVEAFGMGEADDREEVPIACLIGGEQDKVVIFRPAIGLPLTPVTRGDVDLTADDRLNPPPFRLAVELDRPGHPSVISKGKGIHPARCRAIE